MFVLAYNQTNQTQLLSTPRARSDVAARVDRAYRQPANMLPDTFCCC